MRIRSSYSLRLLGGIVILLWGCGTHEQIEQNQRLLQQQQTQINQLQREIEALQTARSSSSPLAPPGGCDESVMQEATRKAGERFAANDLSQALSYYRDAVTACPRSPRAQLNLAHVFETMNDRPEAISHYKDAAAAPGPPPDAEAAAQAREALARLQK
jgi:Tfp pilus assembly protein PilF